MTAVKGSEAGLETQATKRTIVITSTVRDFYYFMNKRGLNPRHKDYINVVTCHYGGQEILGSRLEDCNIIYHEDWRKGMYWQDVEATLKAWGHKATEAKEIEAGLGAGSVFERIVRGEWVSLEGVTVPIKDRLHKTDLLYWSEQFNENVKPSPPPIRCHSGISFFVQADELARCKPCDTNGPYTEIQVATSGYCPFLFTPYFDASYHDFTFYYYVPIPLVRQFIISQGGEAHLPPLFGGVSDAEAIEVLEGEGSEVGQFDIEIEYQEEA